MQIYIEYGQKEEFLSYKAPSVPRIGEEICYEWPNEAKTVYFLVEKVSHYTDGDNYEVTLSCRIIRKIDDNR